MNLFKVSWCNFNFVEHFVIKFFENLIGKIFSLSNEISEILYCRAHLQKINENTF